MKWLTMSIGARVWNLWPMFIKKATLCAALLRANEYIQGFFTAYLSVNAYYLIASEMELTHGFCDMFLMPDLQRYDVAHSYILELKYLSAKDSVTKAEE